MTKNIKEKTIVKARVRQTGNIWKLLMLGALSLILLAGCGGQPAGADNQDAKDQFLAERSTEATVTPDPNAPQDATDGQIFIGGPGMMGEPGVFGEVEKVEGNRLTVKNPMEGYTTIVELAEDAKVYKQVEAKVADVKVGERIMALGTKDGDVLSANTIQIGVGDVVSRSVGTDGPGIIPRVEGRRFPQGGDPNVPQNVPIEGEMSGTLPEAVFGTVQRVEGDKITVKPQEGKEVTVQVGPETHLQKRAEVNASEIKIGENIIATGEKSGEVFKATQIQIGQAMMRKRP